MPRKRQGVGSLGAAHDPGGSAMAAAASAAAQPPRTRKEGFRMAHIVGALLTARRTWQRLA
jgi:hypothetical protein